MNEIKEQIKRLKDWEKYYLKLFQKTKKAKYNTKRIEIIDRILELYRLERKTLNIESQSLNKYPPNINNRGVNIMDNQWHHIAVTYTASGSMKVYKDGVEVG